MPRVKKSRVVFFIGGSPKYCEIYLQEFKQVPTHSKYQRKKNPIEFHAGGWKKEPFSNIPKHS